MRIIGGKFKGRKISFTNSSTTRPLRDYVKENIFNIILHGKKTKFVLEKINVLDLYSGVGSFGIECLSRNVSNVVFVERDPLAFSILKKNILKFNVLNNAELVSENIENYIHKLDENKKFDLFFLDPPFKDNSYLEIVSMIKKRKLFKRNHRVIIHRERESQSDENLDRILKIDLSKNYGRSKIIFGSF